MQDVLDKIKDLHASLVEKHSQVRIREKHLEEREAIVEKRGQEIAEKEKAIGPREAAVRHVENVVAFHRATEKMHDTAQHELSQLREDQEKWRLLKLAQEQDLKEIRESLTQAQSDLHKRRQNLEKEVQTKIQDLAKKIAR